MPASQKIITKLRERRQIGADLREMLAADSELEFHRQAQLIAGQGSQVIPTIVGSLNRADARMLSALGTVAGYLDRRAVMAALRQAVLLPQLTDHGRIGAITILERFLGAPPDDDLLANLRDPEEAAISSLEEVLQQAIGNPAILIEYVQGLDRQEPDVVVAVVQALRMMVGPAGGPLMASGHGPRRALGPAVGAVEPLRMMAQDVRQEIAAEALQALGAFRLPEAVRALQTLIPISAPELRPLAVRTLRKLRFAGVPVVELSAPDPNWRALVSPVDGLGQRSVWFILENRLTGHARFLNILLSDRAGAFEAVGHSRVPVRMLPPRRSLGYLHDIALQDGSGAMLMVEAAFDLGRRLVLDSLAHNRETQIPVAGPLRLLSPWLWGYAGADSLPPASFPLLSVDDRALDAESGRLLDHPAFATWHARSETILHAAEETLRRSGWDLEVWVRRLAGELFADPAVAQVLSRRLTAMSEWLWLAGDEKRSRLALVAAQAILEGDPQELPFVKALVRRDLKLFLESLEQGTGDQ